MPKATVTRERLKIVIDECTAEEAAAIARALQPRYDALSAKLAAGETQEEGEPLTIQQEAIAIESVMNAFASGAPAPRAIAASPAKNRPA